MHKLPTSKGFEATSRPSFELAVWKSRRKSSMGLSWSPRERGIAPKNSSTGKTTGAHSNTTRRRLAEKGASGLDSVVMIQCVGSRNDERHNCSRICCQSAVKNTLAIKKGVRILRCLSSTATCACLARWKSITPRPGSRESSSSATIGNRPP